MAENLSKRPAKGILKTSSSFEKSDVPKPKCKETKWDEINILATLHPPDKDYGHTKIDEPKTPYNYWNDGESHSGDELDGVDADVLAERIQRGANLPPKILMPEEIDEEDEEEDEELDEEEREKRMIFDAKRKAHYNEFQAVKLARKLMERDEEEDEEDDDEDSKDNVEQKQREEAKGEDISSDDPSSSRVRTD